MREKIIAGNWKMNNGIDESKQLLKELLALITPLDLKVKKIIVSPSFTNLHGVSKYLDNTKISVAAQNLHQENSGAYTGEVSAHMLKSINVNKVILGHSERRMLFGETNDILASKVNASLKHSMEIIFCIGESLEDRESKSHFEVVSSQIKEGLFHLSNKDFNNIILAYEPVWAIGTGKTASPEQAQEMHNYIRNIISDKYGDDIAQKTSIIYGGSCNPNNALDIFSKKDVDGGLIGGASLKAKDFLSIINCLNQTY
ncbi:triose-phosphate isomerase [Ichthyobacterium seriolicida]|uniref:Triosephosphate isomerase n=1 Tax=Ichthyobacterium seriolicida TaxID=242600 RepID=A0A1J1DW68_9FLAO|nr:triose-phosphate isomerase [Ichthyobacterium seriolicida]BAV94105.1 triosephosphate isomerase [Ichthyobacterium seriolicida]